MIEPDTYFIACRCLEGLRRWHVLECPARCSSRHPGKPWRCQCILEANHEGVHCSAAVKRETSTHNNTWPNPTGISPPEPAAIDPGHTGTVNLPE